MRYGKSILLGYSCCLILTLATAGIANAQSDQCSLNLTDLRDVPELMGFRIGMTKDEVKTRVPQVVFGKTDEFGVSKVSINPDFDSRIDKSKFPGIRTVSLDFLDGRLSSLWLGYDSSFKWSTLPDFIKGISASLHLPDAWTTWRTRGQRLRCTDFQMTAIMVAEGPSFRIMDETAEQTVATRRADKEEQDSSAEGNEAQEILADRKNKVYYPHGCQPPTKIEGADRVIFMSSDEAQQSGYKVATGCKSEQP